MLGTVLYEQHPMKEEVEHSKKKRKGRVRNEVGTALQA